MEEGRERASSRISVTPIPPKQVYEPGEGRDRGIGRGFRRPPSHAVHCLCAFGFASASRFYAERHSRLFHPHRALAAQIPSYLVVLA